MSDKTTGSILTRTLVTLLAAAFLANTVFAAAPVVKTVPWVASNSLIPHDTWVGKTITLKGTVDSSCSSGCTYSWDFGDGSPVATGGVSNIYAIQATHSYAGAVGTVFTARLTVVRTATGETGNKEYYVQLMAKSLEVEVNVAIDEGLWYLHKAQQRVSDYGYWHAGAYAGSGYPANDAANVTAFEVNGHLQSGDPANPYVETVNRGLRYLFQTLTVFGIANQTNPLGTFNPDTNGNGLGITVGNPNSGNAFYQSGQMMDAFVATGTPAMVVPTGPANVIGRTYKDIVQDMADAHSYCQTDSGGGGWEYYCYRARNDNSVAQWSAIGLIPAIRAWGVPVPQIVKDWNVQWLIADEDLAPGGRFGYDSRGYYPWGPYALTPSGMVQMAMDGIGRGNSMWDRSETFMRDNFGNGGGCTNAVKDYYYGLFSFVKSMLLHDPDGDGVANPITLLQSSTAGVPPIDWYAAEVSLGAPTDGVARTLVNDQAVTPAGSAGYWWGHNCDGTQNYFETAWAIIMLNRTIFEAGAPVAVAQAIPNPAVAGQTITLDGTGSFHQDPTKSIVVWEWDLNNDGTYDTSGPIVTNSWPMVGDYPVKLRVTDNSVPPRQATTVVTVRVTTPPIAPTANAGGPYNFCVGRSWFLDGTGSVNPDEGQHEPGRPGDTIVGSFTWDLNGDGTYGDRTGPTPNVTGFWGPGSYLVQLQVCDTTATSFPSSGQPNLCDTDSAQVVVRAATDPACACISNLAGRPKLTKAQLTWTNSGAHHYNVYRGLVSGGPYIKIASTTSTYSTYLDNGPLTLGVTYYYIVRPATIADTETCQSNQAAVTITGR